MKDDANGMASARPHAAYAVAKVDAIRASGALHGTMTDRENDGIALLERHDFRTRLHAWPLLGQDEFAAREIAARL